MKLNQEKPLQRKINRLMNIALTDGVQPSDLADNIFETPYSKITFFKNKDYFFAELVFEEESKNKMIDITMKYTYSDKKRLLKIEETSLGTTIIKWDRIAIEEQLIKDIIEIKSNDLSSLHFIKTLPDYLKTMFNTASLAAA